MSGMRIVCGLVLGVMMLFAPVSLLRWWGREVRADAPGVSQAQYFTDWSRLKVELMGSGGHNLPLIITKGGRRCSQNPPRSILA